MLTGKLPFPSETQQETMIMRLTDRPKSLADMRPEVTWPAAVQGVMDRALARDAKERYPSASDFGQALFAAVREMPMPAESTAGTLVMGATPAVPRTRVAGGAAPAALPPAPVKRSSRAPILVGSVAVGVILLGGAMFAVGDRGAAEAPGATGVPMSAPPAGSDPGPATLTHTVTIPPAETPAVPARSYYRELSSLFDSIGDSASAVRADRALAAYRSRVTTRSDSAAMQMIDAKVALLTGGAARGCDIMRKIDQAALSAGMKNELVQALPVC
jgi:hypothetical protein